MALSYLKETRRKVGEIDPVIISKEGLVVDGRHRRKAFPKWRVEVRDLTEEQIHSVRLVRNTQRRKANEEDYNEYAQFLVKKHPGNKRWLVDSGETIVERISNKTGIPVDLVREYLDDKYKGPQKAGVSPASLGRGKQVRVPEKLEDAFTDLVAEVKKEAAQNPKLKRELIHATRSKLKRHREEISEAGRLPETLKALVQTGKMPLDVASLLNKKVPPNFIEADANVILNGRMDLAEAESFIISQQPFYRAHNQNTDQNEEVKPKIESAKEDWGPPCPFLDLGSLQVESVRDNSIWFNERGQPVSLRQKIEVVLEELTRKTHPGDLLSVRLILRPRVIGQVSVEAA